MAMWYVYSSNGSRLGPITDQAFRKLVQQGKVQRNTIVANQFGRTVMAGSIPGLPFPDQTGDFSQLNTGAAPLSYGMAPNAEQDNLFGQDPYGQGVQQDSENPFLPLPVSGDEPSYNGALGGEQKNKVTAGILALLLGGVGVHKFYMGSWGWGIVFIVVVLLTGGIGGIATSTCGLVEGILYLTMSQEQFDRKYPPQTAAPFRW